MRLLGLLGLIVMLRWFILAVIVIAVVWFTLWCKRQRDLDAAKQRRRERADLVARADQQQQWRLEGDPRGWYGNYPPAT